MAGLAAFEQAQSSQLIETADGLAHRSIGKTQVAGYGQNSKADSRPILSFDHIQFSNFLDSASGFHLIDIPGIPLIVLLCLLAIFTGGRAAPVPRYHAH
ncbi:MAG TPA: hypothetical protein VN879_20405 [Candidatus Acidoferrales bacterium]|nr:hypothetical protein [Candidatus Acidoferrales bacterium]